DGQPARADRACVVPGRESGGESRGVHGDGRPGEAGGVEGHLHPQRHGVEHDGAGHPHRPEPLPPGGSTMSTVLEKKQAVVDELSAKLTGANAFYLTDFTGLNVKSITDLRRRLRNAGVEYLVVKNTLAERALAGTELPDIAAFFRGPTAVVLGPDDPAAPANIPPDVAKEQDNKP